ncbi:MAG: hypothetical protein H6579_04095 [Chitinophagales bacterium]|nr:hypothetical protein [Chitinophagales bacterium]
MKLSEIKKNLENLDHVRFIMPNGELLPEHFHLTEIGQLDKSFIDCGGTLRKQSSITFQLWTANDYDHRLAASKLLSIIALAEDKLQLIDGEIEVEYQGSTIEKYQLSYSDGVFHLLNTHTDCLAQDKCGIPQEKLKKDLASLQESKACCAPNSGCC